jgi:molecular chaperone GrpE
MSAEPKKPEAGVDETGPGIAESGGPDVEREEGAADPVADFQAKADENWDRYVRTAAELENVRKRARRDVENAHRFALESFGKELLAVVDSLEMGLEAAESADQPASC